LSIPHSTIARLFRESFGQTQDALLLVGEQDREAFAEQVRQRIQGLELVQLEPYRFGTDRKEIFVIARLRVKDPTVRYDYENNSFQLLTDAQHRLKFGDPREPVPVGDIEEIVRFAVLCQEAAARRVAQKKKREKVRALRTQAVMAQVRQLVQSEGIEYTAETNQRGVKLYLNLDNKDCLELEIPFKGFEQALPHVREAVQALRALTDVNMRFRLHQMSGSYRWDKMNWMNVQP